MRTISARQGFTLIEFLMTLALMAILCVLALSQLSTTMNEDRFNETIRRMQEIRKAMVGDTSVVVGGGRTAFGYIGDVGALPPTIAALTTNPGFPAAGWAIDATTRIGLGWNGPYLKNDDPAVNYTLDGWGNAFVYDSAAGTLVSYGANGVGGGTGYNQTITMEMPANVTAAAVYGAILSNGGGVWSGTATVVLNCPNGSGALAPAPASYTVTINAGDSGAFSFTNVPPGVRSVSIYVSPNAPPATPSIGPVIFTVDRAAVLIPTDQTTL